MGDKIHGMKRQGMFLGIVAVCMLTLFTCPAIAFDVTLFGAPLGITGYLDQSAQFGITGDHYDTMAGFQQGLTQFLVETQYKPRDNLAFFVSGLWTSDLAYAIYDDNNKWVSRGFQDSRDRLAYYRDYESYLKEAHVTWSLKDQGLVFRVGKQIVSWGELDGIRIMDQINPLDQRRGLSDVQFENSIMPIWLAKLEYFPPTRPTWLTELGFELVFNPNADFITDKAPFTGGDKYGIWGADVTLPSPYPPVLPRLRVSSSFNNFQEPGDWNYHGYEYGFRVKGTVANTIMTLNYFDGVENSPVFISKGAVLENMSDPNSYDNHGRLLIHPLLDGLYARLRYAGFTASRDIPDLRATFLGGVAPVVRIEAQYVINYTFATDEKSPGNDFEKHDQIRTGISIDWKIKIPFLNPDAYFTVAPQFIWQHILDFPSLYKLDTTNGTERFSQNYYTHTLRVSTTYFLLNKRLTLEPFLYWQRDYNGSVKEDILLAKLQWDWTDTRRIWITAFVPVAEQRGSIPNQGFEPEKHKASISLNFEQTF